tara:strand:- start:567 stop:878 length:312 start_codon:yes stop_codon:yes gene_type:complete
MAPTDFPIDTHPKNSEITVSFKAATFAMLMTQVLEDDSPQSDDIFKTLLESLNEYNAKLVIVALEHIIHSASNGVIRFKKAPNASKAIKRINDYTTSNACLAR